MPEVSSILANLKYCQLPEIPLLYVTFSTTTQCFLKANETFISFKITCSTFPALSDNNSGFKYFPQVSIDHK